MNLKGLIEHLGSETRIYKELVAVLQTETDNLVDRDYEALYGTVSRKEHLLLKLESLSETRTSLMNSIGAALGINDFINLSAIIELVDAQERKLLRDVQSTILSLIDTVKELNKVNAMVVEGSLENIQKTLGLIVSFMPRSGYKPTGGLKPVELKGSMISEGA